MSDPETAKEAVQIGAGTVTIIVAVIGLLSAVLTKVADLILKAWEKRKGIDTTTQITEQVTDKLADGLASSVSSQINERLSAFQTRVDDKLEEIRIEAVRDNRCQFTTRDVDDLKQRVDNVLHTQCVGKCLEHVVGLKSDLESVHKRFDDSEKKIDQIGRCISELAAKSDRDKTEIIDKYRTIMDQLSPVIYDIERAVNDTLEMHQKTDAAGNKIWYQPPEVKDLLQSIHEKTKASSDKILEIEKKIEDMENIAGKDANGMVQLSSAITSLGKQYEDITDKFAKIVEKALDQKGAS